MFNSAGGEYGTKLLRLLISPALSSEDGVSTIPYIAVERLLRRHRAISLCLS